MRDPHVYTIRIQKVQGHLRNSVWRTSVKLNPPLAENEVREQNGFEWTDLFSSSPELLQDYIATNWANLGLEAKEAPKPAYKPPMAKERRKAILEASRRILGPS